MKCVLTGKMLTTLINCTGYIHPKAYDLHKITRRSLRGYPNFAGVHELIGGFLHWVGSDESECVVIIAHNASFDFRVMKRGFDNLKLELPDNWVFADSIPVFKELYPGLEKYKLSFLADHFQVKNRPTHRSLSDVLCLEELFFRSFGKSREIVAASLIQFIFTI